MTDYQKLADRCVRAEILEQDSMRPDTYCIPPKDGSFAGIRYDADVVVHDWRVVGAAMELCLDKCGCLALDLAEYDKEGATLPIAILTACLDALEAEDAD